MITGMPGILLYELAKIGYDARMGPENEVNIKETRAQGYSFFSCTPMLYQLFTRFPNCTRSKAPIEDIESFNETIIIKFYNGMMYYTTPEEIAQEKAAKEEQERIQAAEHAKLSNRLKRLFRKVMPWTNS